MKKILLTIIIALSFQLSFAQTNYKKVEIKINSQEDVSTLIKHGIDLDHYSITKQNSLIAFLNDEEFERLSLLNFSFDVLIDDWYDYYSKLPKMSDSEIQAQLLQSKNDFGVEGFTYGSMGGFLTFNEVIAKLDSMRLQFPNLITAKFSLGNSIENRPIYMVKISDNPDIDEQEPEILYTALHHAREPQGMMQMIYFMYYLLENYNTNPEVQQLVNNRELFFIPVLNPDGYEYNRSTNPNGGGNWRKNRRNNGGSYGVDLNRNYGPMEYWNAPNGGSSTSPSSDTYRGTAPFSEPETDILKNFLSNREFKTTLNYHTYSNLLIYPYGALSHETPDSLIFREYASDMTRYNGYSTGTDMQTVGYSTRGNSDDFFYDGDTITRGKIFAMTPEVGTSSDGFWPQQSRILPLAQENLFPNLYYAKVTGDFVTYKEVTFDRQFFSPGDNAQMFLKLINKGLSASAPVDVNITSLSQYVTIPNGSAVTPAIEPRTLYNFANPFNFSISINAPIEHEAKFVVTISQASVNLSKDTISIIIGIPTFAFIDTTNNPVTLWTLTSTPTTQKWEAVTTTFVSSPNSYHESKNGLYAANSNTVMTITNPINLSGFAQPRLTFWTKYDIESNWDYGQVEISTNNGSTWTPLQGRYTEPGQGSFQPNGQPLYDGMRANWVKEEINLSAYGNQQVKIRFEFRSDGSLQKDGWYLDDIGIYVYGAVPVELNSFNATNVENKIILDWSTATETNNRGFEIERSASNHEWKSIGFVEGNGNSSEPKNYTFADEPTTRGKYFYRLKQIDFNGTYRIYGPIEINLDLPLQFSLEQNYPNPFNPSTVIGYQLSASSNVTLKIYDVLGNEVATLIDNEWKEAGFYNFQLIINNYQLTTGVYFYRLQAGNFTATKKFVLMK